MFKKGQSGNPNGRPKRPEIAELREALLKAKKKNKKSFIQHVVDRAYEDDTVAVALAKKILPDLTSNENDDIMRVVAMPYIKRDNREVKFNVGS